MNFKFFIILFLFFSFSGFAQKSEKESARISFSQKSGVYKNTFDLELKSSKKNTEIYYTLDGSSPSKTSKKYTNKITISENKTIRAVQYIENKKSEIITQNYIVSPRKFTLPILFISMNNSDLFDFNSGIYAKGPGAKPEPPYHGANYHKNWEKTANIQLIDTSQKSCFNQIAGIKIAGQYSRMLHQKSFAIIARKKYGNNRFKYPIFPNRKFKKYKSFVVRNSGSDNNHLHFRDILTTSLAKSLKPVSQDYLQCVVFLNGKYWGIYNLREKINEHFLKQHFGVKKNNVALLKHRMDVQHYGRINYGDILKYIKKTKFKSRKNIDSLAKLIDIDNYLDYNITETYINNIDAGGNIRYWRKREKGSKWRWILYDTDFGFHLRGGNGEKENTVKRFTTYKAQIWPTPPWSTLIIRKLLENDSIKERYLQKSTQYLNTIFDSTTVLKKIKELENNIKIEYPYHQKRWKFSKTKWKNQKNIVKEFAKKRPFYMRKHLAEKFGFDTTFSAQFYFSKHGKIRFDSYKKDSGEKGIYFSQKEYFIKAKPKFGYDFVSWEGDLISKNEVEKITLKKNSKFTANFKLKSKSKHYGKVKINEVSIKDSIYSDYIEIYNLSKEEINIKGWVFQKNNKKKYRIKGNITLNPGEYFTVFKDSTQENSKVKNSEIGLFNVKKKSLLKLFSAEEELVDSLQLTEKLLAKKTKIEFENSLFNNGWVASESVSINKENTVQANANKVLKTMQIIALCIFVLLVVLMLFLRFKKRKK